MKILKNILFVLFLIVITVMICEAVCRIYGLNPYSEREVKEEYRPKLTAKVDPVYGYSLVPGYFTIIKNDTLIYHATHTNDGRRVTSYDSAGGGGASYSNKLIFLGCSFTYGDGIDDSCTHPFILQDLFKQNNIKIKVENWGVGGYCPAQFFLQANEIIKDTNVKYVVVNYSQVEDERAICGRMWRKSHVKHIDQQKYQKLIYFPYFTLKDSTLHLGHRSMEYNFLPFQKHLAIIEYIDNLYCTFETRNASFIAQKALKLTIDTLEKKGIKVILASITGDPATNEVVRKFDKEGYNTLLFGINTSDDPYSIPGDGHPNYRANKIFAAQLYSKITSLK